MSYQISTIIQCREPFLGPSLAQVCPGTQFLVFMTILDNFIRAKQEISQLCQRINSVNMPDHTYDFIVIGGGTAGSVVASRLSEEPKWKVLLIEAGPDEPPGTTVPSMVAMFLGTDIDWQYRTTNEKFACLSTGGSCSWPRGKSLGGTSVHNGMMYIRGHARDYNNWAALGNIGWTWEEVLPYFLCSENNTELFRVGTKYHTMGGPLNIERFPWQPKITQDILGAANELGLGITEDLNGDDFTGFTVAQFTQKQGTRQSSSKAFLHPVRHRSNLHVIVNATATRIITENKKATGVQFFKNGQFYSVKAIKEVVVSGGAVNSPQMLLLSGIGPKEHLQSVNISVVHDLPGVGENLINHVSYTLSWTINEPNEYDLNWAAASEYLAFRNGPMASTGLSQITGIVPSSHATKEHPDLQFFFGGYQAACATTGQVGALLDNNRRSISISPTVLHPRSRGRLRLRSNNPFAHPIITGNYFSDPLDAAVLVEGIQIAMALINTTSMSKHFPVLGNQPIPACNRYAFRSPEYWRCAITQDTGPENHQVGSCKMGPPSDSMAVVDPELKVYGIRGLRVADASIMPMVTSGNTAGPSMMIGERVADFIKKDWGIKPSHWYGNPSSFWNYGR